MVTIADVARQAGVGAATVSRVINDSPKVSEATRARVRAAIERLDYHPSPLARALSRGRCQTLGVVIPSVTQPSAVERLRGVVAALDGSRYDLVLFNVESPLHRDEHLAALTRRDRADGLLIVSIPPPHAALARLRAAEVPIVLVDCRAEHVPRIVTDDVEGGRMATRHLVELGHRRIAFIGDDDRSGLGFTASGDRERGCRDVLRTAKIGLPARNVRRGPHDRLIARSLAARLLDGDERPSAIFASSDVQALGVLEAARDGGLSVPGDLSVVGFDDIDISTYAGLTSVRQPLFESGYLGAKLLLDLLAGNTCVDEQQTLPLELIVRSTTGPVPVAA